MAKSTIGLNRLILSVRVPNLNNAGKGEESTAEETQSNPQRTTDSRIWAVPQHPPIITHEGNLLNPVWLPFHPDLEN
jgi:hypothetical protein